MSIRRSIASAAAALSLGALLLAPGTALAADTRSTEGSEAAVVTVQLPPGSPVLAPHPCLILPLVCPILPPLPPLQP